MLLHKIKGLCHEQGITLQELEKECGLGKKTTSNWNRTIPRADSLYRVAKKLGTTVEALLEGCDGKSNQG